MNIEKTLGVRVVQNIPHIPKNLILINPSSESLIPYKDLNQDTVSISVEAKNLLAEDENLMNRNLEEFKEMMKQLRESSDGKNPYIDRIKCIQIAMRIMSGDNVPNKDKYFLAENEPQMYSNALLLRKQNDKPKDYDSILEDDEGDAMIDASSPISMRGSPENTSEESVSTDNIEVSLEIES